MNRERFPRKARATGLAGAICLLGLSAAAQPASPGDVVDPAPTAGDWANLGKLPDWSGVWIPESYMDTIARSPPPWKPQVLKDIETLKAQEAAGHPKGLYTNCLPEGMPSFMIMTLNATELLYTPGRVTILNEFDGNRQRRIHTDGRGHPEDPDLTFNGHSIGHWQGDTLVVDTVAILPETYLPISQAVGIPNDGDVHIVERIRLTEPNHLVDELVIEAPHVLAAPWRVTRNLTRSRERRFEITEGSCRQGDFAEGRDAQGHAAFLPLQHDDGARIAADSTALRQ
jgi:hypothetical protein